jgi:hypothetical protein
MTRHHSLFQSFVFSLFLTFVIFYAPQIGHALEIEHISCTPGRDPIQLNVVGGNGRYGEYRLFFNVTDTTAASGELHLYTHIGAQLYGGEDLLESPCELTETSTDSVIAGVGVAPSNSVSFDLSRPSLSFWGTPIFQPGMAALIIRSQVQSPSNDYTEPLLSNVILIRF